jgi:GTP pyrophosphokinase
MKMTKLSLKAQFQTMLKQALLDAPGLDAELLERAFNQAVAWYGRAGENYMALQLPCAIDVCGRLAELRRGTVSLVAALLHPLLEKGAITKAEIEAQFGKEVAGLADGVATLTRLNFRSKKAEQVKSFRKMFLGMANDVRTILIKLVERERRLIAACDLPDPEQRRIIGEETLEIYAPIAGRLGIQRLKVSLENLAFMAVYPDENERINTFVEQLRIDRKAYMDRVIADLGDLMKEHDVAGRVDGRIKHTYSIWRKMKVKALELNELYDIIAFRVIVEDVGQCYHMLGLVHSAWHPIPQKIKDYIATPKPNGYQSLHTNVIGPFGDRMEIQIRTEQMHEVAENGVAAHWQYKESAMSKAARQADRDNLQVQWLRMLMTIPEQVAEDAQSFDSLRLDLFSDYVFAFTPTNEIVELPAGSTTVDFAFAVHTQVGMHITGAKVNGKIVPIRYQLQNGDVVEIITQKDQKPRREWLDFVKTGRARSKIRHSIHEEEREASRKLGRELCEREFKQLGLNFNRLEKSGDLDKAATKLRMKDLPELLISLGRGQTRVMDVVRLVDPELVKRLEAEQAAAEPEAVEVPRPKKGRKPTKSGIRISDIDDILVRYGKCCNPIPGDHIIGFITRGRGVTIHRANCSKIPAGESERVMEAYWDSKDEFDLPVSLKIISRDRSGVLKDLTSVFSAHKINIESVWANSEDGVGTSVFKMRVADLEILDMLKRELMRVRGVVRVERVVDNQR